MKLKSQLSAVYAKLEASANPRLIGDILALGEVIGTIPSTLDLDDLAKGVPVPVEPVPPKAQEAIRVHLRGLEYDGEHNNPCETVDEVDISESLAERYTLTIQDFREVQLTIDNEGWWSEDEDGNDENGNTEQEWASGDGFFFNAPTEEYYRHRASGHGPVLVGLTIPSDATELGDIILTGPLPDGLAIELSLPIDTESNDTPTIEDNIVYSELDDTVREVLATASYTINSNNQVCHLRRIQG